MLVWLVRKHPTSRWITFLYSFRNFGWYSTYTNAVNVDDAFAITAATLSSSGGAACVRERNRWSLKWKNSSGFRI